MTPARVLELADQAGQAWGGLAHPPKLIRNRENVVFEVQLRTGQKAAMRLHRQGYQSVEAIEAEMIWTEALSRDGFPCPRPVLTDAGARVVDLENGPVVSLVSWIDAEPIGENGVPYLGPTSLYENLGGLIGKLHRKTAALTLPNLQRPSWDANGLLGENPHWGRFWQNPSLSPGEADFLQEARKNAAQHFLQKPEAIQLIHADLLQENILQDTVGLWLIDFDDSGYGYPGYDLGTALIQHAESPRLPELKEALVGGYSAQHPDAGVSLADVSRFIMLRSMASCGWIMLRAKKSDPRQRFYAERALSCAAAYLSA